MTKVAYDTLDWNKIFYPISCLTISCYTKSQTIFIPPPFKSHNVGRRIDQVYVDKGKRAKGP